jgi:hypothetical protein
MGWFPPFVASDQVLFKRRYIALSVQDRSLKNRDRNYINDV